MQSDEASTLLPFELYVPRIAEGVEAFCAQHSSPFLVFETIEEMPSIFDSSEFLIATTTGKGGKAQQRRMVSPVAKRPGASASRASKIMVGRATDNDIVIVARSVSKLHAWFVRQAGGAFGIVDAGSANGTWVGKTLLPARGEPVTLKDGDVIKLGDVVSANFMTPKSFANLLEWFARTNKKK